MKKIFFLISINLIITLCVFGQSGIPTDYYNGIDGLSESKLKTVLYGIIKDHDSKSYSSLWTHMKDTDKKEDGKVWDMYSDGASYSYAFGTNQCGNYTGESSCYNREHSFPKSWFNNASPMSTDLFHLYPTDGYVNGKRSNYPFGEIDSPTWTSENGSKVGPCAYPGYTGIVFEPIDQYKGDFARTYFYMATRYENVISGWSSAALDGTDYPCYEEWCLNMLIDWHHNDPVSDKEIARNDAVYQIQNNRNPFIDHPEFVALIWGGDTNPSTDPKISINTTNVSGLDYALDEGPSEPKSIILGGLNLTEELVVSPSENIEISLNGTTYTNDFISIDNTDGTVNSQNLFVRLKAGLASDTYSSEYLQINSAGATQVLVSCVGSVGCIKQETPIATNASNVNATFFIANWDVVSNSDSYLLSAYTYIDGGIDMDKSGDGSLENPFTVQQALDLSASSIEYYVKGYIAGGRYDDFEMPASNDYGISIASTSSESEVSNCLQIKLETALRSDWGMNSQAGRIGAAIIAKGIRSTYGGYASFKSVNSIEEANGASLTYLPNLENKEVTGNSFLINGLTLETAYYYKVRAASACGDQYNSDLSNEVLTTTSSVDSELPTFTISTLATSVKEGDSFVVSVSSDNIVDGDQSIGVELLGINSDNYTLSSSLFQILDGTNTATINIDMASKISEIDPFTFSVSLLNPSLGLLITDPTLVNVDFEVINTSIDKPEVITNIYPNPFKQFFTISSEAIIISYKVFNMDGLILHQAKVGNASNVTVDASAFSKGCYIVRVTTKNGYSTSTIIK